MVDIDKSKWATFRSREVLYKWMQRTGCFHSWGQSFQQEDELMLSRVTAERERASQVFNNSVAWHNIQVSGTAMDENSQLEISSMGSFLWKWWWVQSWKIEVFIFLLGFRPRWTWTQKWTEMNLRCNSNSFNSNPKYGHPLSVAWAAGVGLKGKRRSLQSLWKSEINWRY